MQGPVHGVTSANSWKHNARAELRSNGNLHVWVDGRPLALVYVGVAPGRVGMASYTLLDGDIARLANVTVVGKVAATAAPFDTSIKQLRSFRVWVLLQAQPSNFCWLHLFSTALLTGYSISKLMLITNVDCDLLRDSD